MHRKSAGSMTRARATMQEDADEPLMRSNLLELIWEEVNTLSAQRRADQAARQPDIADSKESSSSGTTYQTPAITGKFNISVH